MIIFMKSFATCLPIPVAMLLAVWINTPQAYAGLVLDFDSAGKLVKLTGDGGGRISFSYDPPGNITSLAFTPSGGTTPVLTSDPFPWGLAGVAFNHTLTSSRTPSTFTATGLPPGLALNSSTAVISGTPTAAGVYSVNVTVNSGTPASTSTITIQIRPARTAPAILRQPQSQVVRLGEMAALTAQVEGSPPMTFQWRKGTNVIPGATGLSFTVPSFSAAHEGIYTVTVTNASGSATSAPATLSALQVPAFSGEPGGLVITHDGTPPWTLLDPAQWLNGRPTLRSGAIGNNTNTAFLTTVAGPGVLSWKWKVSSQRNGDGLAVVLDNTTQAQTISGEVDWTQTSLLIPAGSHTLAWAYFKNGTGIVGQDAGWVSDITYAPGWQLAAVATAGGTVSLSPALPAYPNGTTVAATAIPATGYYFNGWTGASTATAANVSVLMDANKTLTASFKEILGPAVGAPQLFWRSGGNLDWKTQPYVTKDGGVALQSGAIGDNQMSWTESTVFGPGTLSFWWKVSSEEDYDKLRYTFDGGSEVVISGEVGWEQKTYPIAAGSHVLRWNYTKDGSTVSGSDSAWLDTVVFTPSGTRTFNEWAVMWNLPGGQNGMANDPNGDGIPNLLAYAFALNPITNAPGAVSGMPTVSKNGNSLVCTYRKSKLATGITWTPQVSTELSGWSPGGITNVKVSETSEFEVWTASVAISGTKKMLRVKVSQP